MIRKELYAKDSGMVFIISYIAMLVTQVVLLFFTGLTVNLPEWAIWTGLALNQAAFFIASSAYVASKGLKPLAIAGFKNKLSGKQLALLPLFAVGLIIASAPIAMLFSSLVHATGYNMESGLPELNSPISILFAIFFICILPPVGEEFLFRNSVLRGLKRRGYFFAAITSSLLFCLMHGNPDQLVHQFFVGMMLAFVMQITGNLLAPMILHFCNNMLALIIDFVLTDEMLSSVNETVFLIILVLMILLGAPLLYLVMKSFLKAERDKRTAKEGYEIYKDSTGTSSSAEDSVQKNLFSAYLGAMKTIALFFLGLGFRKRVKSRYNTIMLELDRTPVAPSEDEDDLMRILIHNDESLGAVYVAFIGSALMVALTFMGGLIQ